MRAPFLPLFSVLLLAATQLAMADDTTKMIVLPNSAAVQWSQGPASLPKVVQISLLAGDPAKTGPFTLRLKIPANTILAPHTHAKLESVTVLSGAIYHEDGEKLVKSRGTLLTPNAFVSLPPDMAHSLWTTKPTVIQVSGTGPFDLHYINPTDDPRNQK